MRKKLLKLSLFIFFLGILLVPNFSAAQERQVMEFFHGRECPHCQKEKKWFPELLELYPYLEIGEYEVWHDEENKKLWEKRMIEIGGKVSGVPTNIIGEEAVVGFVPDKILELLAKNYGPPAKEIKKIEKKNSWFNNFLNTILGWFGV